MKFKYFLRGLGVGIIFASIVLLTAYQGNLSNDMTDAEIIEKAKELGMVEKEDQLKSLLSTESDKSEDKEENLTENNTTEAETTEDTTVAQDASQEPDTTEQQTTEESTTTEDSEETVSITVDRGSSSFPVCQKMQEAGLIEDASEFDTYLIENGYANRIRVGTHVLKKGMSFYDLAEAISDPA